MTLHEMMYLENKKYSEDKKSKKKVVKEAVKYSESDILNRLFDLFKEANEVLVGTKGYYESTRSYTFDKNDWRREVGVNLFCYVGSADSYKDQINYYIRCDGVYYEGVVDVNNKSIKYDKPKVNPYGRDNVNRDLSEEEVRDYLLRGLSKFINDLSKTVDKNRDKIRTPSVKVKHPTNDQTRNARYFGNPYDGQFSSEEERQSAIKSYEKSIQAAETRLDRNANLSRSYGGYDKWHEDKDSIGYMYDRLSLMKSAKLK